MNPFGNGNSSKRALILCIALVIVCYWNSLSNAFILDDILIVAANERIRHIDPVHFLLQPYWRDLDHAGIYRPLTILSFSLEYPLWKLWAPGYRALNLLLHALNGWLVYLLAAGILGSPPAAAVSAIAYVVHPMQTEAVVSIVGRSELLAAFFFFLAWLAFRKGFTCWSAVAYFLAVLAKESAIMFPAVVLLEQALAQDPIRKFRESWSRFALLAITGLSYLGLRFFVLGGLGIPQSGQYLNGSLTLGQRWVTSGRVFIQYFRLLFIPVRVTGDYDFNSIPVAGVMDWDGWLGLIVVIGCLLFAAAVARKKPALSLGILFFFITLLPVSNWITPIALLMAERFLYTPAFGFALLAGIAWAAIPQQRLRLLAAAGVLAMAVPLCIAHNYIWQDTLTFHRNAVATVPNNARARLGYGFALLRIGKPEEAKREFEAGLQIMPSSPPLLAGLARAVMRIDGGCDRVRPVLARALSIKPGQWQSLWVLADCLQLENKTEQAEQTYRFAVENSDFPDATLLTAWGRTLEMLGKTPTAIAAYERAAVIDPADDAIRTRLSELRRASN